MSDCRISASSLFSGALPSVDRRMWLFFFAALLFLHSTQTHAHTRTHGRNTLHRRTADNLLLVVWPVPNPPPPGARMTSDTVLSYPPAWFVQSSRLSLSEVVMAREPRPLCAWICQARARHGHTRTRYFSYLNSYLRFRITVY